MTERVIIPEHSSCRLVYNREKDGLESLGKNTPLFFYDADFIFSVIKDGYETTADKMGCPTRFSDDKKIDMLVKDLFSPESGYWSVEDGDSLTETERFVKSGDRAAMQLGELVGGKIPVSGEIWSKALLIFWDLNSCRYDYTEHFEQEGFRRVKQEDFQSAGHFWVNVVGDNVSNNRQEVLLTLPLVCDAGYIIRYIYECNSVMIDQFFNYRFEPTADEMTEAWALQTYINQGFCFPEFGAPLDPVFFLCTEPGRPFKNVDHRRFIDKDIKSLLIRGLIRIQNHLNNPGMTDEEYLSLING